MQGDPRNYGRAEEPAGRPTSPQDERVWSALSHASILVWPATGLLPIAPLIIWLVYKDRSPHVGFHALQSLWYQLAWLAIATIGGILGTLFSIVTFGFGVFLVIPLAAVLGLVPFAHSLYAAYRVYTGADFRYPYIADRMEGFGRTF